MAMKSSRAGMIGSLISIFLLVSLFSAALDAEALVARSSLFAAAAIAALVFFRLGSAGIFETSEGIMIKRLWHPMLTIATTAEPTAHFERRRIGHRLIVEADGHELITTSFVLAKPDLERRMSFPSSLALRRTATASA